MTKIQMKEKRRRLRAWLEEYVVELRAVSPITGTTRVAVGCSTVAERLEAILEKDEYEWQTLSNATSTGAQGRRSSTSTPKGST